MTRRTLTAQTQAEDRQPALGIIRDHRGEYQAVKLPVWLGDRRGHGLLIITEYADGRLTLATEAER